MTGFGQGRGGGQGAGRGGGHGVIPLSDDPHPPGDPLHPGLENVLSRPEHNFRSETPMFTPAGGWRDGRPPWEQDNLAAWRTGRDPLTGGSSNQFQQMEEEYRSPWLNIPDQDQVVEATIDPWDLIGGMDAMAPVVQQPATPQREIHWQGPQPEAIPLGQVFESEARDWRSGNPPTIQEQKGLQRIMPQNPSYGGQMGASMASGPYFSHAEYQQFQQPQQQYNQPQQQQQQFQQMDIQNATYGHGTHVPRIPKGPTYQQLYLPLPAGGTVWEQQRLKRPPGPLTWKDTRAYSPGPDGDFDPFIVEQLETGTYSPWLSEIAANIEAIDERPKRLWESMTAWRARVITARKAIGIESSELRQRPYSFPRTAKQAGDTPAQLKARTAARRKVKIQWEKDKEVHKNKMDHTHKNFDPEYATQYRAEKATRQLENAKRRKTALLIARRIAERDHQPRPVTPELPEDSSDEDLPAMPSRDRTGMSAVPGPRPKRCIRCQHMRKLCSIVAGSTQPCELCRETGAQCQLPRPGSSDKTAGGTAGGTAGWTPSQPSRFGPKVKRCLYCTHMRKPCTLVAGSPRPCDRCKQRGIVCEITRDLEDPNAPKPAWKLKPQKPDPKPVGDPDEFSDSEVGVDDDEDGEPITAQQKASLSRKKRAAFNQSARLSPRRRRRRSASPEMENAPSIQCGPCKDQSRPCDGERPCGTCRLNGTIDMCSPVSFFSKYRQRDYQGVGQHANDEMDWRFSTPERGYNDVNIEWDKLASNFEEADQAIEDMDLGPMMNSSSQVIMDSFEAGHRNSFFTKNEENEHPAMEPYKPDPEGPSYNRVATVTEPDASYNSLAPEGQEFLSEPFGDVAHYDAMTFGGEEIDFSTPRVSPQYSVESPDIEMLDLDEVLNSVEERRSGFEVVVQEKPDPDPRLQIHPLSDYRQEWKQNLKGILRNKHCDELIGIDICFKSPAKHCDYLQHGIEGGDWHTCVHCHKDQNVRVSDSQSTLIEYTKLYYCDECAAEQRPRTSGRRGGAAFKKEYCTCTSQMRKSWLCNTHRDEAIQDVTERALAVKNWLSRKGLLKCNGCDTRHLGYRSGMWACASCKDVVYG
ncbi:uncharacterized protein EAE97_010879 [Botrytis byssoidea]|uniref:Zn(2)-C6 fungal-type domain-containing protein n=1 Tax=Botrytis byssoidea TaxID=139641 RepID=A0A9P5I0S4_9HELO|nr:uncharacterized protein EAE97_010879 [Botrytis byssoidea]KAF7923441.1 hypothetical protein EAE97_010879 [Botrytis byssoidea]